MEARAERSGTRASTDSRRESVLGGRAASTPDSDCLIVHSDVGILPIVSLSRRFAGLDGRERAVRDRRQPAGVDGPGDRPEEAQALLQVPDARAGEGVPVQRLRVQAEAVGTGQEPEPDRAAGQDLVPESTDEEQEELAAAGGAAAEQQQQRHQQPEPPRHAPPRDAPHTLAAPRGQPPRRRQRQSQAPPVTYGVLRGCARPPPRPGHLNARAAVTLFEGVDSATLGRTNGSLQCQRVI
jgi:hypothetical protein